MKNYEENFWDYDPKKDIIKSALLWTAPVISFIVSMLIIIFAQPSNATFTIFMAGTTLGISIISHSRKLGVICCAAMSLAYLVTKIYLFYS